MKGSAAAGGDFTVSDYRFAGLPPPMKGIEAPATTEAPPTASAAAQNGSGGDGRWVVATLSAAHIGKHAPAGESPPSMLGSAVSGPRLYLCRKQLPSTEGPYVTLDHLFRYFLGTTFIMRFVGATRAATA